MSGLLEAITREGQPYVDEPIFARVPVVVNAVRSAFGHRQAPPIPVGHKRVTLRWMKPDGQGGLVPR